MTEDHDRAADAAFDHALGTTLQQEPAAAAPLSRAVLSRLAEPALQRQGGPELAAPLPLGGLVLGGLLLAGAAGYGALPFLTGGDLPVLILLGEVLAPAGGF